MSVCPGTASPPRGLRAYLDAILVCANLLDRGAPPQLLPELLCEYERHRLEQPPGALARMALAREWLFRRMVAAVIQ